MKQRPRIHCTERQKVLMSMGPSPKVLRGIVSREVHSRCAVHFWHTQAKFLPASLQTLLVHFFGSQRFPLAIATRLSKHHLDTKEKWAGHFCLTH
jgi:hypothetical protein